MIRDFYVAVILVWLKIKVLQGLEVLTNLFRLVFLLLRELDVFMRIAVTRKRLQTESRQMQRI